MLIIFRINKFVDSSHTIKEMSDARKSRLKTEYGKFKK